MHITRRHFGGLLLAGTQARSLFGAANRIDDTLRAGMDARGIPAVVAMACDAHSILYEGAFGVRDAQTDVKAQLDSIFRIASMTKPVTSVAAMQLVEQGKLALDEPVGKHLPELAHPQLLTGFGPDGQPTLRPATKQITLRHLLTHTSGMCYPQWHEAMFKYTQATAGIPVAAVAPVVPLMFEPGTHWQYGYSADWTGRLVEVVSGLALEQYFQRNIFQPLGMSDTTFIQPEAKFDRLVATYNKTASGMQGAPRVQPQPPTAYNGGGGLVSTAPDYVRFMQMFLNYGLGGVTHEVLKGRTIQMMGENQIGGLTAGKMRSFQPNISADVDTHPGGADKWGLGFLINPTRLEGRRAAGSLAWAGIYNTYFWIDPQQRIGGVIMMQYLPFFDPEAVGLLADFERAVYATA